MYAPTFKPNYDYSKKISMVDRKFNKYIILQPPIVLFKIIGL